MVGGAYRKTTETWKAGFEGDWDAHVDRKQTTRDYWMRMARAIVQWARENDWPLFHSEDVAHIVRPIWDNRPYHMVRQCDKNGRNYNFSAGALVGKVVEMHHRLFISDRERNRAVYSVHPDIIRQEANK